MKKSMLAIVVAASVFVSDTSFADMAEPAREHTEELVGVGSGLFLGAIAGGPIGAIIGAFAGGMLGKSVGDDDEIFAQQRLLDRQEQQLNALSQKQQSLEAMSSQYALVQKQLVELKTAQQQKLTELALGLNVQFRTGSSEIEPHFQRQLDDIAFAMSLSPELTLDLTGYADRRGHDSYNQALSEQRLAEVRSYLVNQGVDKTRLTGQAFGASSPLSDEQNQENDFFDRRVTLKLIPKDSSLTASQ